MQNPTSGTLLIVDDEPSVRRSLERLVRNEGYEIRAAENASMAAQILDEYPVDVILCDQDMPGQSGTEFLTEAAARYPHQRRIMLSGRFRSDDVAAAMDNGAIHKFMMKPWDDQILRADIRESFRQLMNDIQTEQQLDQLGAGPQQRKSAASENSAATWQQFDENRTLSRELHEAANNGSLSLQYQPQIDLHSGKVCGLEALLRWDSSLGPIRPDRFIALAERSGSISKLTAWVINEVCYHIGIWRQFWPELRIGVNVSPHDLHNNSLLAFLSAAIENNAIPASALQVEVTETEALNINDKALSVLECIAAKKISLAIDDFGAGATSVAYLASLPFSSVKIDRALTLQLDTEKGRLVVKRILELCKDLNMKTTIEGVETRQQLDIVRELGADIVQGYIYSPPLSYSTVKNWVTSGAEGIPS